MKSTSTHPMAEKLQVEFFHHESNLGDVKETVPVFNQRTDLARLQHDFKMHDEEYDVQREFEIQYEQFITNISGHAIKRTHS